MAKNVDKISIHLSDNPDEALRRKQSLQNIAYNLGFTTYEGNISAMVKALADGQLQLRHTPQKRGGSETDA